MAILIDADVLIGAEKGQFDLQTWVASLPREHFAIAAITVAELWHGVERASGAHKTRRRNYLEAVLSVLPILPYTEQTAYEHARLWAQLEASGKMIGFYDLIVTATALEQQSTVATFNERHFSQIEGLPVIHPKTR